MVVEQLRLVRGLLLVLVWELLLVLVREQVWLG
jgi:hypothetical protein